MLLKGFILGFSIAAPVGPIGLLCIQRTLARGRMHGFVSGLGAATADMLYGMVAALGFGAVMQFLLGLQFWLQLAGGLFLLWLGARILYREGLTQRTPPAIPSPDRSPPTACHLIDDKLRPADAGVLRGFASIFVLTLANPATILSFIAVFAAMGLGSVPDKSSAALLVSGVFLGSATWWLCLSFISGLLRGHLNDGRMRAVNLVAGGCITALGLWALGSLGWARL